MAPFDTAPFETPIDTTPPAGPREFRSPSHRLLWEGAQLIRKYGHTKGSHGNTVEGFCVYGSLYHASAILNKSRPSQYYGAVYGAGAILLDFIGGNPGGVCTWNNAPARTKEEVVTAMEGASHAV